MSSNPFPFFQPKPVFDLLSEPKLNLLKQIPPQKQCPICYLFYDEMFKLNSCTHYFCCSCIKHWSKIKRKCPLCRRKFSYLLKF